jgi:uncharacterized protein
VLGHPSGAVWITASETLVVADLHLGYTWAQRRKGELGPIADLKTAEKLSSVCRSLTPKRVVLLGDAVHAPQPGSQERQIIQDVLNRLCDTVELISVRGNHDRALARDFDGLPLRIVEAWSEGQITALHGDRLPGERTPGHTLLLGHLHPSMPVKDAAGAGRRLPVFLATPDCIVLPAFSPFAHGYNLLDGLPVEFVSLMGESPVMTYVASGTRVVAVGPLGNALERMYEADVGKPAVFRRRRA